MNIDEVQEKINSFSTGNRLSIKRALIKYSVKAKKCEICGIDKWQNKPINLELHHHDGNTFNNDISNLYLLCPNCHSQTKTFRGGNTKGIKKRKLTDDEIINIVNQSYSISEVLRKLRLTANGNNYKYIKKCIGTLDCELLQKPLRQVKRKAKRSTPYIPVTKANYPPVEEMKELVWKVSRVQLAKQLGVQDNAIRFWCKRRNIKLPPIGYWRKLEVGRVDECKIIKDKILGSPETP